MRRVIKLNPAELLDAALATVELEHEPGVEPEPLERFALVLRMLASRLDPEVRELPIEWRARGVSCAWFVNEAVESLLAIEAERIDARAARRVADPAAMVTVISADRPAQLAELRGNTLRVRAELREEASHE